MFAMASDEAIHVPDSQSERQRVIEEVEKLLLPILDGIDLSNPEPSQVFIPVKTRPRSAASQVSFHRNAFPGSNEGAAWKLTVIMRILGHIHGSLVENVVTTKRNIYYQDPKLFRSQRVVDEIVDDIAYTLEVGRNALNVRAAPNGLIYGPFKIRRADGTLVRGTSDKQGILVPACSAGTEEIDLTNIFWVLVIEKEATFRALVETELTSALRPERPGMLVTGKGYPDVDTRAFLNHIREKDPWLEIYGLTDFDPDGLAIASVYAVGSKAMAHEASRLSFPRLRWIGVHSADVVAAVEHSSLSRFIELSSESEDAEAGVSGSGLLRLSGRDRRLAANMLKNSLEVDGNWTSWEEWCRELRIMLMLNIKAEMQVLEQLDGGLATWVKSKVYISP